MTFTVRHGFSMALIEIDGLPFLKMVIFHGYVEITRWYPFKGWMNVDVNRVWCGHPADVFFGEKSYCNKYVMTPN